jgi:hypothetical protein
VPELGCDNDEDEEDEVGKNAMKLSALIQLP